MDRSIDDAIALGSEHFRQFENFYRLNGSHDKQRRKNCGRTAVKTARCKAFGAQFFEGVPLKFLMMVAIYALFAPQTVFFPKRIFSSADN